MTETIRKRQLLRIPKGGILMRKKVNKRRDKKLFAKTAASTKRINVAPKNMRGGIRL